MSKNNFIYGCIQDVVTIAKSKAERRLGLCYCCISSLLKYCDIHFHYSWSLILNFIDEFGCCDVTHKATS